MTPNDQTDEQAALDRLGEFNVEAARAGLFATALDITETMKDAGTPEEDTYAVILTASAKFTAQLWQQVSALRAVPHAKARKVLAKEIRLFFDQSRDRAQPK